jgi:hypothetical protein
VPKEWGLRGPVAWRIFTTSLCAGFILNNLVFIFGSVESPMPM